MPSFLRNPWIWASGIVLLCLLTVAGVFLNTQIGDETWWARAAEAYNREHAVPDEENAFVSLASFQAQLWQPHSHSDAGKPWNLPMSASDIAWIRSCPWDPAAVRKAAALPYMHRPMNTLASPYDDNLSYLHTVKHMHRWLVRSAREVANNGRTSDAAELLGDALRLACQSGRTLITEQWIAASLRQSTWMAWERLAMDIPPPPSILESCAGEIAMVASRRPGLREFWEAEMLAYRRRMEWLYHPARGESFDCHAPEGGFRNARAWLLRALRDPLSKCRDEHEVMAEIFARSKPSEADGVRYQRILSNGSEFLRTMAPGYDRCQADYWKDITLERGVRTLMLIQAFKLRNARYPDTLEELKASTSQEVPTANWDGKPFVYRRLDDGSFRLDLTDTLSLPTPLKGSGSSNP